MLNMSQPLTIRERRRREPLPPWFRVRVPSGDKLATFQKTSTAVHENGLNTVCEEARCPNIHDCWGRGTATFMIGGQSCTRDCAFCSVIHNRTPPPPDPDEPRGLADAVGRMGLDYAVITVVNRDDLPDEGVSHYRRCIDTVHQRYPKVGLELLSGDLDGNESALATLLDGAPLNVFAHNVETVKRLTPNIRDRKASFSQSLRILQAARELRPDLVTKSSIMVGLGETDDDVTDALKSLREANCDLVTFGQYLSPGPCHYPIVSYPPPEKFDAWKTQAFDLGFLGVASGPLVRSSFRAGELYAEAIARRGGNSNLEVDEASG